MMTWQITASILALGLAATSIAVMWHWGRLNNHRDVINGLRDTVNSLQENVDKRFALLIQGVEAHNSLMHGFNGHFSAQEATIKALEKELAAWGKALETISERTIINEAKITKLQEAAGRESSVVDQPWAKEVNAWAEQVNDRLNAIEQSDSTTLAVIGGFGQKLDALSLRINDWPAEIRVEVAQAYRDMANAIEGSTVEEEVHLPRF
jgi:hypothetical protein